MTTFQCPNGFYMSKFNSAHDGSERLYKFGCSKFSSKIMSFDEECTTTESASTANGDMYLSCGSDQYTVGVEIIEDVKTGIDSWQLLCCRSDSVKLRIGDCIDTKFINDHRRASSFSSSAQIIRKWQAMSENGDRRWWLQICPVDVQLKKPANVGEIRARRQVPWEWQRGRFPADIQAYNPLFMDQIKRDEEERKKMFENFVQNGQNAPPLFGARIEASPILPPVNNNVLPTFPPLGLPPTIFDFPGTPRSTATPPISAPTYQSERSLVAKSTTTTTTTQSALEALDYYDMYDEHFDKKKHTEGGILRGVSDLLQNLQDGLTLAQVAFPQHDSRNVQVQQTTKPPPTFMFANDEDSLQIGSFVQQMDQRPGPFPRPPASTQPPPQPPKVNAIENMLQMVGLCNGH
ncbi:unnamed protein product [Bursaphelenchus xylophilus]|uniref:(pine wood nematode) hypothetical protein n=1 Tax=Bursaphelenchus xylophilus TaxID=6326 RepID=A0A1I7SLI6_BURXY|nr:unnamed protein product [Bursaphelenchus xylophilus]CAG9129623.1 unnamed protein product [Bursaphelenchus xylophilus]